MSDCATCNNPSGWGNDFCSIECERQWWGLRVSAQRQRAETAESQCNKMESDYYELEQRLKTAESLVESLTVNSNCVDCEEIESLRKVVDAAKAIGTEINRIVKSTYEPYRLARGETPCVVCVGREDYKHLLAALKELEETNAGHAQHMQKPQLG